MLRSSRKSVTWPKWPNICYLGCFLLLALAVHAEEEVEVKPVVTEEEVICTIRGDADLYGLGVRVGIYFQWLGSYLSNLLLPRQISANLDTNSVFLLSLLVAVTKGTMDGRVGSIDALILFELSYGYFFSVLSLFGFRTCLSSLKGPNNTTIRLSALGVYFRIFLTTAVASYGVWFWFQGVNSLQQSPCEEVVFFFGKREVLKGIRTFLMIISLAVTAFYGTITIIAIETLVRYILTKPKRRKKESLKFWEVYWNRISRTRPLNQPWVANVVYVMQVANIIFLLWIAATVELTLNWNHVAGTTGSAGLATTGQQIPAIIGASTFIRVLYLLFKLGKKNWKKSEDEMNDDEADDDVNLQLLDSNKEEHDEIQ